MRNILLLLLITLSLSGCASTAIKKQTASSGNFAVAYLSDNFLTVSQKSDSQQNDLAAFIEQAKQEARAKGFSYVTIAIQDSPIKLKRVSFYLSNEKINAKSQSI